MALDLQRFVGQQSGDPMLARDAVNQAMIRHWCDAIGDDNPIYTDPEAAARSVHGGIVAPPTMLQAWTMRGLNPPPSGQGAFAELLAELDGAGYTSTVATNCEQEYVRYLRIGDQLTVTQTIESVSDEKKTALGDGHFVTTAMSFKDQHGEVVGTQRWSILKYKPRPPKAAVPPRPRPAINGDNQFFWDGVNAGKLLIQRCTKCAALRHPPGPACPNCGSLEWDTIESSGRGTVYSYVVPHYPPAPMFGEDYVVVLVELDEGVRFVSDLIEVAPGDVEIGMPVEVSFVQTDPELTLPLFKRAGA
ncbi:MAG: 3-oxo-4,17-pregnadiene-20-carboxyl-CoA hydratase alpha subunit [Actinomycetota bacterium]|jgi:uncharacterized OB-fold protein/acyl dehydratase|nr:3-oxo-4,17-pregnadiene-20-carboxyl-CoA hydratase alpha subunit [Actinomycetota bacterium]